MIPIWATHKGKTRDNYQAAGTVFLRDAEDRWCSNGPDSDGPSREWWPKGHGANPERRGFESPRLDFTTIRPINPEMRREVLVADAQRHEDEQHKRYEQHVAACGKRDVSIAAIAAHDREHGTGEP